MVLAFDIGNSQTKIGIFQKDELSEVKTIKELTPGFAKKLIDDSPSTCKIIYSSVREVKPQLAEALNSSYKTICLTNNTPVPFINKYETPETLGRDRIAAVAGGMALFNNKNILVIDAGTCITYDILTERNEYLGGGISPGLKMRFKAMHTFTGQLPLIEPENYKLVKLVGATTKASIESGVKNGTLAEIDGIINQYKKLYSTPKVIITGGDHKYFDKYLKNNIFAAPNLVLIGLKKILDIDEDS